MSGSGYKSFIRLIEKWPLEASKKGKDIGESIRCGERREFTTVITDCDRALSSEN